MKNKNEIKIKYLVLWLADSCNLNCKYCYAHPNFTNKFMNFEIAKKAIDLYADKNFTLILAGGEPFLSYRKNIYLYKI